MGYIPDFTPGGYMNYEGVVAIGWLDAPHPFPTGPVPPGFVERLTELLDDPWEGTMWCGSHRCTLCRVRPAHGMHNLFVPGRGVTYQAPELVLHYVVDHQYRPPDAFVEAVRDCPKMRSAEYARRLYENSPGMFPPGGPTRQQGFDLPVEPQNLL